MTKTIEQQHPRYYQDHSRRRWLLQVLLEEIPHREKEDRMAIWLAKQELNK